LAEVNETEKQPLNSIQVPTDDIDEIDDDAYFYGYETTTVTIEETPIEHCIRIGFIEGFICLQLTKWKGDFEKSLVTACRYGHIDCVKYILEENERVRMVCAFLMTEPLCVGEGCIFCAHSATKCGTDKSLMLLSVQNGKTPKKNLNHKIIPEKVVEKILHVYQTKD